MTNVRVELLGPLRLLVDDVEVPVPGPKRRAALALLALAEGRAVTVNHLLDALWPGDDSGRAALQTHVSRLRSHLGPVADRLRTLPEAYGLALDTLDLAEARNLLVRARTTPAPAAVADLQRALALWRGPVLADLRDVLPVATAVAGIDALHREITDALLDRSLESGVDVLAQAAAALADDPLREPAVLRLMRAQAAAGQAPQALGTAREFRRRLVEETGLDPSPDLAALESDIAAGRMTPTLRVAATGAEPPRSARPSGALIGRAEQLATVRELLDAERLVTVAGPGGVGKTRVALEVAADAAEATVLLLAPVTDPDAVPHALASALNLTVTQGDVLPVCLALLAGRRGLLVVDNCEHLLDAARDLVTAVLAGCPDITVLATSREPLGPPTETVFRLPPLDLPDGSAVFLDRAARVRPGLTPSADQMRTISEIVAAVDGMPLAIELAAGRLSTFSPEDLRDRLDRSLDLLGGRAGYSDRHRTLRATVEWSYDLLGDDERALFRHLSVFPDGVDLATVEEVGHDLSLAVDPGSALARLVDASMVEVHLAGRTRYRMLETLRAFGVDRLRAAEELDVAERRLIAWGVRAAKRFEEATAGPDEPAADAAVRAEFANLRAAFRAARARGDLDSAIAMVVDLYEAAGFRDLIELRRWASELAADDAVRAHRRAAEVLGSAAWFAYLDGTFAHGEHLVELGFDRAHDAAGLWHCRAAASVLALARGDFDLCVTQARAAAEVADGERVNDGLASLAMAYGGDPDGARELNQRCLAAAKGPTLLSWVEYFAGEIECVAGDATAAEPHYLRALELAQESGATFVTGVATVGLVTLRAREGRAVEALTGYRETVDYFERTGNWTHQWTTLRNLADLLRDLGDPDPADLLDAAADAAPDAPATGLPARGEDPRLSRDAVLALARDAIDRALNRLG